MKRTFNIGCVEYDKTKSFEPKDLPLPQMVSLLHQLDQTYLLEALEYVFGNKVSINCSRQTK